MDLITLARHKNTDYTVNYDRKGYVWSGSKGKMVSKKQVPIEVYDYLAMQTSTFQDGELVIVETSEEAKELVNELVDKEEYDANKLSKEDIEKLLNGNYKKMEAELKKVTSNTTKQFVLAVAKEIKLENSTKQRFIKEWLGTEKSIEDIFFAE